MVQQPVHEARDVALVRRHAAVVVQRLALISGLANLPYVDSDRSAAYLRMAPDGFMFSLTRITCSGCWAKEVSGERHRLYLDRLFVLP